MTVSHRARQNLSLTYRGATHASHTMLFPLMMFLHKHVRRLTALSQARVDSTGYQHPLSSFCPSMGMYTEPGECVTMGSLNPLLTWFIYSYHH